MTTRHVERLIDFNHEMLEPLQFHIDEDIHYKKEDVGIRASGYLYLSGKYKAKEGIRLFQELLEVDILAPFEKIADESAFAVHVKDYDYSVRDGDLLIDITIEIAGLDESTVRPDIENELDQLETEMFEEDELDDLDDLEEIDELDELDDLDEIDNIENLGNIDLDNIDNFDIPDEINIDGIVEFDESPIDRVDEFVENEIMPEETNEPMIMTPEPKQIEIMPEQMQQPFVVFEEQPKSLESPLERNVMPGNLMPETTGWNLADLIAFENDNTNYGLDFQGQEAENAQLTEIEKIAIPEIERQIRNYITSKQLTEMLQNSMNEMQNEPVRILFNLQEIEEAAPVAVTTSEGQAALQAWRETVERLQREYENTMPMRTASYEGSHDEMAELIRSINANVEDQPVKQASSNEYHPFVVNKDLIHEMNQEIHPKEAMYYQQSHAKKPLANDIKPKMVSEDQEVSNYEFEPKVPNLDVPFTRGTVFPWEMQSMYDKYEFTVEPNDPIPSMQPDYAIRNPRERQVGSMYPYESQATSADAPVLESDEMLDLIDLIQTQDETNNQVMQKEPRKLDNTVELMPTPKPMLLQEPMLVPNNEMAQQKSEMQRSVKEMPEQKIEMPKTRTMETQNKTKTNKKQVVPEELNSKDDANCAATMDVSSIEDLFEDADSKVVNMRIIIAREHDTYESLARRYQVSESKLTQQNHNKPIHERALIIIPLD